MLIPGFLSLAVTANANGSPNTYTLPTGFDHFDQIIYTGTDAYGNIEAYNPNFTDYTITVDSNGNKILNIPGAYSGTFDLYYEYNEYNDTGASPGTSTQRTLEQLYQKVVSDIGEDPDTLLAKDANGNYVDTVSFIKIRNELNRAVRKIARERFRPTYVQTVTLDSNLSFDVTTLTKTFHSIVSLTDANGRDISFAKVSTSQYKCPERQSGEQLTLTYEYIPADMANLTDTVDLPEGAVDPDIICYWADYMWFKIDGNVRKANAFLELWNDGFNDEIEQGRGETYTVKNVYSGGWVV